jgi:glycosyltransferase involved in cell wall biosynthesis
MKNPQISVVMPAYNAEKYITEAINSILSQTFTDFEFIIINDASTDSTKEIIGSFQDPRIKLINNEQNQGVANSLNIGIAEAKGKHIARMDADDISLPHRLQTQFDFMEQNPEIDICGSWIETFGDNQRIIKVPEKYDDIKDELFFSCPMLHPTLIFKKNLNLQYSSDFPRAEDYDLWCRKINELKFANIPKVLLHYRIHSNQVGKAKKTTQNQDSNLIRLRNLENIGLHLSDEELRIYNDFFAEQLIPQNIEEVVNAVNIFEKISIAGKKYGHGEKFQELIKLFQRKATDFGIKNSVTSLKLYFTTFRKMGFFDSPRANLRYMYHCLRNLLYVKNG